ncbi:MAG: response regulator [Pseudomonadota bacterium]|nr:response regulator [Pseudomonadota bacterium]
MSVSVMVIDDDPGITSLLKRFLEQSSFQVLECNNSVEAMDLLTADMVEVVMVDLHMPQLSGFDLIEKIRRRWPALPIIAISGTGVIVDVVRAMRLGAWNFIEKPISSFERVGEIIRTARARSREMREKIRAEEQCYQQRELLEAAVAERSAALTKSNEELQLAMKQLQNSYSQMVQQEKLASIGSLAAGIAHELNTPVGFVSSNFNSIKEYILKFKVLIEKYRRLRDHFSGIDRVSAAELEELAALEESMQLEFILDDLDGLFKESEDGFERITSIVSKLREFSRVDQREEKVLSSINQAIETTLVVARNEYKYNADVSTALEPELPEVYCHIGQINQVILNIIVNAAQAIKEQQRQENGSIEIETGATAEYVWCRIKDDGPGIKPEHLKKVFDPFFTTKPPGQGTGLGLNISYDIIVNQHQGELIVESEPDCGTAFTIKLPR